MKKFALLALIPALFGTAALAQSAPNAYINAGVTQRHTSATDTASLTGRIGTNLNQNFGVEAEAGFGISDDKIGAVTVKQKGNLGGFAVGRAEVAPNLSLLGRMGYSHTWAEASAAGLTTKSDDGSFAAGVGAEYMFDEANGVRGDYTRLTKGDGVDNFAVAYVHKF